MADGLSTMRDKGLYDPSFEHDNCGIGAIINIRGEAGYQLVCDALSIVENLEHRAGRDASGETGDGVGILTQIPHRYFTRRLKEMGVELPGPRQYGVGMFFFPASDPERRQAMSLFTVIAGKAGLKILAWRKVDCAPEVLGARARECMPEIYQAFIGRPPQAGRDIDFDRMLYIVRREFEQSSVNTYVPSLSCRTIVYKGMFLVGQLRTFFKDLQAEDYESAVAMVHSRFSTNTAPSWNRAHPNRCIVHNNRHFHKPIYTKTADSFMFLRVSYRVIVITIPYKIVRTESIHFSAMARHFSFCRGVREIAERNLLFLVNCGVYRIDNIQ